MPLNYDYVASKNYCTLIGLNWLGDDYQGLIDADETAKELGLTQYQVDSLMRSHLWQTKILFTPKNYNYLQRIIIALYFLTGFRIKKS